jgi:hypothetical protein
MEIEIEKRLFEVLKGQPSCSKGGEVAALQGG